MAAFNPKNRPEDPQREGSGTEVFHRPERPSGEESNDRTVESDEFAGVAPANPSVGDSSQTFISDEHDPVASSDDSRTFLSDEHDPAAAEQSKTFQSDEIDPNAATESRTNISNRRDPAPADSRTFVSDEFDPAAPADSKTIQSDELEGPVSADSRTFVSDEFADPAASQEKTYQSDEFDGAVSADARTMMSDDLTGGDDFDSADDLEQQHTFLTDEGGPRWADTGAKTMVSDPGSSQLDSATIPSDEHAGLMAQSNVRQTINPKSMDSRDRKHWNSLIRGALGSQAVASRRRPGDSSLSGPGGGSNLIIQTRMLVEGDPLPGTSCDFRIERKLGEGGMGAVYLANQTSLNRNVALKVIKPISDKESVRLQKSGRLQTIRQHREGQFLSEAVVTGDLEHPNIVPIYDVAATQDGTVFYAMKCVVGTPWSKVVRKKSLNENLDILMRVCDAMAFAHSRGIVHRDLKPENVMLGEFGVVLVMDWGLALATDEFSKQSSVRKTTSLGGSPAYMSPELATGPIEKIGPAADIYLIGAMLYEVITGRPPHSGSNVSQCLRAAAGNKIDPSKDDSELMQIALRAMATKPDDRYATVQAFQEAVRGYLSHAESIALARRAKVDLHSARDQKLYADYARAMFGFEQALDMWEGNEPARLGLSQAQLEYAELALSNQDFELGLSLLSDRDTAHAPIISRLRAAQQEQESHKHRLAWMKRVAAVLLAVIFLGGSGALAYINEQKNEIAQERDAADEARIVAVDAKKEAEVARDAAVKAEVVAKDARDEAIKQKDLADAARLEEQKQRQRAQELADAEKVAKEQAIVARNDAITAQKAAEEAQKVAEQQRMIAVEQRQKAELAAEQERKAKEAEAEQRQLAVKAADAEKVAKNQAIVARNDAIEAQKKAEAAEATEKLAKERAVAAAEAEKKAKELETQARLLADSERKKAEEAREAEAQQRLVAQAAQKKAEAAAEQERKAKEAEAEQRLLAVAAADAEKKAKEQETLAKNQAIAAKDAETKAKNDAIVARNAAIAAREAEELAKNEALAAKDAETRAKQHALYESYIAKIGLAKARIDQNEFAGARSLLQELKQDPDTARLCGWEWSRLMHQASQAASDVSADQPARDVSFSSGGRKAVAAIEGGAVKLLDVADDGSVTPDDSRPLFTGGEVNSAAISEDESLLASAGNDGVIRIVNAATGVESQRLEGHRAPVTKVRFLDGTRLLSASRDKTVRLWDVRTGRQLAVAWHIAPVEDVAAGRGVEPVVAAAVADSRSGRAVVWQLRQRGSEVEFDSVGDFVAHGAPVLSVTVSADGSRVASGDGDGRVYVWQRDEIRPLDYGAAIDSTINRLSGVKGRAPAEPAKVSFVSLEDDPSRFGPFRLLDAGGESAHREAVRSLGFSADASRLVSASDDFTLKVWDVRGSKLLETLRGHGGWVRSAAFAPFDDNLILSAGYDKAVKSWKLSSYSETVVLDPAEKAAAATTKGPSGSPQVQAHDDEVWSAHFNRAGNQIITTSRDQSARLWHVHVKDGKMGFDGPIILTDNESAARSPNLVEGHRYLAMSIEATPDGKRLLIGGVDGTLRVFDVERGTQVGLLPRTGLNTAFALSRDGRRVLAASSAPDVSAQMFEFGPNGEVPSKPAHELAGHQYPITAFAISGDGARLFTGDQRGIGLLWDAATGRRIGEPLTYHNGLRINAAVFLPDGRLVTASDDQTAVIYDPAKGDVARKFPHQGFVTALDLSPDGRTLLTISERGNPKTKGAINTLFTWDLASGTSETLLSSEADGPTTQIRAARFSPDGSRLVTIHGGYDAPESFVRLWKVESGAKPVLARTLRMPSRLTSPDAALFLPMKDNSLVTLHGNAAFQWGLADLEHHQSYRSHAAVTDGGFSADGKYVATSSESVKIWDAVTGKPLYKLESPHQGAVTSVEFTPVAGKYLFVTAGTDGSARVWQWDPARSSATPVQTLATKGMRMPAAALRQACFSADGACVLAVGDRGGATLWKLGQEAPVATLADPAASGVNYLCGAFSSDGKSVVVGGSDQRARLWRIDVDSLAASNPPAAVFEGHADQIDSVSFVPDETLPDGALAPQRVLTASRDRSARLWDVTTGREVMSLRLHSLGLTAVDATTYRAPGSNHPATLVMTAGLDGRVILWPAE